MTTKSELQAIHRQRMADRREHGEPPTAEEMLAYTRGELSPEDEARVQERLVAYPELLQTLTAPFPEAAQPGDPDYVSDAEFAKQWKRPAVASVHPLVPRFWRNATLALAASLICVFGALLWQMRSNVGLNGLGPRMSGDEQMLYPDGRRGPGGSADTITTEGDAQLSLPLVSRTTYAAYRIELVDAAQKRLWDSGSVQPRADAEKFTVIVPHAFLDAGQYRFVLYGIEGGREERLTVYTFRVPEASPAR
jgi:hypothetical protein